MSSFKNAAKSHQKTHKERSQLQERASLGHLEKRQDYRLRARDHERKKTTLRLLKKKALNKNPDEFYFHMINSKLEDGSHHEKSKKKKSEAQLKRLQSQDFKYINHKKNIEMKKINKLKASLHLLDADKPTNRHTFFVEDKKEASSFDVAERLDTLPEFLDRNFNRPCKSNLGGLNLSKVTANSSIEEVTAAQNHSYKELSQRLQREKQLSVLSSKMEIKYHLANNRGAQPCRIMPETKETAPVYRWVQERKR